ncbi:hypothetical protein HKCCE2091_03180 [Rhodobacterales bacterium HKCCE2091]|nr:hypothetical protein [Rhodobacterales bacterium HKCCE2091]
MTQSTPNSAPRPVPVPTAESRVFWDGAEAGRLTLRRCTGCGRLAAPLAPRCAGCLGAEFEAETLSGRAVLGGRTVLHVPGIPGGATPATLVQCAVAEDPRIGLVALDTTGATKRLRPGDMLSLSFADMGGGVFLAVARPGAAP